jgi:hypothetical protein
LTRWLAVGSTMTWASSVVPAPFLLVAALADSLRRDLVHGVDDGGRRLPDSNVGGLVRFGSCGWSMDRLDQPRPPSTVG